MNHKSIAGGISTNSAHLSKQPVDQGTMQVTPQKPAQTLFPLFYSTGHKTQYPQFEEGRVYFWLRVFRGLNSKFAGSKAG